MGRKRMGGLCSGTRGGSSSLKGSDGHLIQSYLITEDEDLDCEKLFDRYDKNSDGHLEREECVGLAEAFYRAELRCLENMERVLKEALTKERSSSSATEHALSMLDERFHPIKTHHKKMIDENSKDPDKVGRKLFDLIDTDHDEKITKEEFKGWVQEMRAQMRNREYM